MNSRSITTTLALAALLVAGGIALAQEAPKTPAPTAAEPKPKVETAAKPGAPSKSRETGAAGKASPKGKPKADPLAPDPVTGLNPLIAAQVKAKRMEQAESPKKKREVPPGGYVDINSATKEELKKLKGLTDEMAARIIAGRPFPTKARLISNDILPMSVYQENRARIIAVQKYAK